MKHKKGRGGGKKIDKSKLTEAEIEELVAKQQEKIKQEHDRKEQEKYDKYISELREQNLIAALLLEPLKSIISMTNDHRRVVREKLKVKQWNEYLSCSNLPNPRDIPAVREFLYCWQNEIQDGIRNFFAWTVRVDERSLLTQDRRKPNLCFSKLYNEQPVIGEQYLPRIEQCHMLLNELNLILYNNPDPDLTEIKNELRTQLSQVIDFFTVRILSNVERDMVLIDERSAHHNFKSKTFSSSMWSTRPVPQISENWRPNNFTEINFSEVDAVILVPNKVAIDGFSYRVLLKNYDHLSETAKSSFLNIIFPPTPDLRTANEMAWKKKEEMMHQKLDQMREDRAKWEKREEDRAIKKEEALKKKPRGPPGPDIKPKHKPKQKAAPIEVTEHTVVDVSADYLQYEEDMLMQQNIAMSPEALNLSEYEVNLREYKVIGGIYSFNYLVRPPQYTQLKHQFLFKIDTRQMLEYANYIAQKENDWIEIRIKLRKNVNWWFTPVPCYWQPWEESEEFLALSPQLQDFHLHNEKYVEKLASLLFAEEPPKKNYEIVECLKDFVLNSLPRDIDLYKLVNDYLEPKIPITFKFQVELAADQEILRKKELYHKEAEMEKMENNAKRRENFTNEMNEYLATVRAEIDATVIQMGLEFEQFYETERQRLVNHGENDLQIERYIRHKRVEDQKKMADVEDDKMAKYRDFYDEQFKARVLALEVAPDKSVHKHTKVVKQSPRDLFPTKPREFPLKLVDGETVYNFDVPNESDPPGYDGMLDDNLLLSTFLRYLAVLFEKSKPIFKETPKAEVIVIANDAACSVVTDSKTTSASSKKPDSGKKLKQKKKPKTPKKLGKKTGTPKKSAKKPKTKKKSTPKPNSPSPNNSPRSEKSSGRSRSRSAKKKPRSASSKKSSASPKSKKSSKSPRKSSKKRKQKTAPEPVEETPPQPEKETEPPRPVIHKKSYKDKILKLIPHFPGKWVRSGINLLDFNTETCEIKLQVSRFGIFGFAMPQYCNFPYTYWEIYPNAAKKHSVLFKVISKYAEIKIEITADGYKIERIVPNNISFVPNSTEMQYRELKNFLRGCGFNIFPERDAGIYVEGNSEKHRSMEDHTYFCIAQFTMSHYFRISEFNRTSNRLTSIFEIYELRENVKLPDKFAQVLVTPQKCYFVSVTEVTSKTGEQHIEYKMDPKDQEYYPDLFNLMMASCNDLSKKYHNQMRRVHRYNVARLLLAIRPLSFA